MSDLTFPIVEPQTEAEYKAIFEQASLEMDAMFHQMEITRARMDRTRIEIEEIKTRTANRFSEMEATLNRITRKA